MAGASLGNIIRNNVPKAALYAPIAAVGFVWLALGPLTVVAREPLIGIFFFRPPHPFLPYAAPHFSHISPFILVFQESSPSVSASRASSPTATRGCTRG
jgi:hypothetical protein